MENFKNVLINKYAMFNGRASRKEYWMFFLFGLIISIALSIVDSMFGLKFTSGSGLLGSIFSLAILVPSLAVAFRRLHDTDHSGWWLLIGLVPIVGCIVLLVFLVSDSTPGDNVYGQNPTTYPIFGVLKQ